MTVYDDDNDKYKRRSVFTWLAPWLRSRQSLKGKSNRKQSSSTRRTIYLILVILFTFVTILTVLYHFTRGESSNDPFARIGNTP